MRNLFILIRLILVLLVLSISNKAQGQLLDSAGLNKTVLPIVFYSPETSLGFGGSGLGTFRLNGEPSESKTSSIILGFSYTLKNQILFFLPYEIYKRNEDIRIKGELGFYKYFYNFNGIGGRSRYADLETYEVIFPRLVFTYSKAISRKWKVGIGYKFDNFNITNIEENGILETQKPVGYRGGRKSTITLQAYTDTRDNTLSAYKGYYIEGVLQRGDDLYFSDFDYFRFELDMRYYQPIKSDIILGAQFYIITADENTPFFDLGYAGDSKHARGYPDRRYINHNIIASQIELRYPIFKRFRGATFLTTLLAPDKLSRPFDNSLNWSAGMGIRFLLRPEDRTSVRIDVAGSEDGILYYFLVNEAF